MSNPTEPAYTPSTEDVLGAWVDRMWNSTSGVSQFLEFDRWLSEVKAAAWDEGANVGTPETAVNPYRMGRPVVEGG